MAEIFMTDAEKVKVETFIRELKTKFERDEFDKKLGAERRGEQYEPKEFVAPSEEVALAQVRAGWQSWLDKKFAQKRRKDNARGIKW